MENGGIVQQLSRILFWDVDADAVDSEVHQNFIILRVMDRDSRGEVRAVWNHYGADTVRCALLRAPSLQRKTIFFFANQFQLHPEDFRAYRKSQDLGTWLGFFAEKYSDENVWYVEKSLSYFTDADEEPDPRDLKGRT